MLRHPRDSMATLGAWYPPGPVLEQLTAPTPEVRHVLHRASAPTEQLTDEVLDLALEPLRAVYPQTNIRPAGTSAWDCSAVSRPHTREAWWNSG